MTETARAASLPPSQPHAYAFTAGRLRRLLLMVVADGRAAYVLLTLLCAVVFGAGLSTLPPIDRDEARFMQATKQMVERNDYIHIRVQDQPRVKKPIGIYWLQAAAVQIFAQPVTTPWPYRIPSALAAWAAVLMVCAAGRFLFGDHAGLIAGAMTATAPIVVGEAHLAKTDAVLLACVTLAMTMLARAYMKLADGAGAVPTWQAAIFWLAVGAGVLIKGPVILLVVGLAVLTLCIADHSTLLVKSLHPAWGVPLAVLVIVPWIAALLAGGELHFINDAVREDVLPKLIGGQETHGAPPGTHLLAAFVTLWPWSLVVPPALIALWSRRHDAAVRFCLAWLVPGWLAFEAIPTKLPHYVLPMIPAVALLVGAALQSPGYLQGLLRRPGGWVWRGVWALATAGLAGLIIEGFRLYGPGGDWADSPWVIATAAIVALAAAAGLGLADRLGAWRSLTAATFIAAAVTVIMWIAVVPSLDRLWVSQRLTAAVARHPNPEPLSLVGFWEPSAVFLLGTTTRLTDAAGANTYLRLHPGALAAIDAPSLPAFTGMIEAAGFKVVPLDVIAGQNYARGAAVTLTLLTITPQ